MTEYGSVGGAAPLGTVTIGGDLPVGRIGFGAMQLTGPKVWGDYPDHGAGVALLRQVVEDGGTFIDTADVYGPHSNESLIREALHHYPADLVIATKGGFVRGGPDYSDLSAVGNRVYLRQCVYTSLRRLGLEQIGLYYLHTPTATDVPFLQQVETLAELRQEGLIKHIGLSNVSVEQFQAAQGVAEIAAVTAHFNVAVRAGASLLAAADAAGVVFSPWHPAAVPRDETAAAALAVLQPIADGYGATVQQVALSWQLHRTPVSLPIPGTTSPAHLRENLAAAQLHLTSDEVASITQLVSEPASPQASAAQT